MLVQIYKLKQWFGGVQNSEKFTFKASVAEYNQLKTACILKVAKLTAQTKIGTKVQPKSK